MEQRAKNCIDLKIRQKNKLLELKIFKKPTFTNSPTHAKSESSNQSIKIKLSYFHNLVHRIFNKPLSQENVET